MIGPVFFEEEDVEVVLAMRQHNPAMQRVIGQIQKARALTLRVPPPCANVGYRWSRLLEEQSPVAFQPRNGRTLDQMSRMAHAWANNNKAKVVTRQIDGALHVWLVRRPRDA